MVSNDGQEPERLKLACVDLDSSPLEAVATALEQLPAGQERVGNSIELKQSQRKLEVQKSARGGRCDMSTS